MNFCNNIFEWDTLTVDEKKIILSRPIFKKKDSIEKTVKEIIKNVKKSGNKALNKYTVLFDKCAFNKDSVSQEVLALSSLKVDQNFKNSILIAKKNIESFHNAQNIPEVDIDTQSGVRCQQIILPLNSVGIYVPGGSTSLFSTVLMLAIPAKLAKCQEIILCSPPPISSEILYSAYICGIDKVFQVGGAQAIAALSFGTETIPKVDKIFGPGNAYVTEAKLQISNFLDGSSIDMLAGPSELLIIADRDANPDFIAADLLSQAEHDISSQVVLVTPDINLAKNVIKSLNDQIICLPRYNIVIESIKNSKVIIANDLLQCMQISNLYAPEHLMIQTKSPRKLLKYVLNASSIFLGSWSPESAGDYASGTNHVLPTYGKSVSNSALGLLDFQKRILIQELTPNGLIGLSSVLKTLSTAEKLKGHSNAVDIRIKHLRNNTNEKY